MIRQIGCLLEANNISINTPTSDPVRPDRLL